MVPRILFNKNSMLKRYFWKEEMNSSLEKIMFSDLLSYLLESRERTPPPYGWQTYHESQEGSMDQRASPSETTFPLSTLNCKGKCVFLDIIFRLMTGLLCVSLQMFKCSLKSLFLSALIVRQSGFDENRTVSCSKHVFCLKPLSLVHYEFHSKYNRTWRKDPEKHQVLNQKI